ncbi:MAG: DUF1273 domain-containing protein [Lachnospiraceae bacterium]|nr:DUF1273 domain-containing protein [Lachnospiraceae bacterium]
MNPTACAFSGHRPRSFPWKYNEADQNCVLLKRVLAVQIQALAEQGVTDFLSGMALGVDLWSARIVLDLQKSNASLKLHCILPCKGQEIKWADSAQEQYKAILKKASEVIYVSQEYTPDCMLKRNRYLVDHSTILLSVYNGTSRSGTGATVNYARKLGREIFVIDPLKRSVTHEGGRV